MLKLLIGLPLFLVAGAVAMALALPLLALLPVALAIGAVVLAMTIAVGVFGFVFRLFAGLLVGAGVLLFVVFGFGLWFAAGAAVLALGFALAHLLLPVLVILGVVWLIRRASRPAPALPAPHA